VAEDKSITGGADRRTMAVEQPYDLATFAARHGISTDEARKIIEEAGPDRLAIDAAVERYKVR
jgi:hypothetical protein